MGMSSSARLRGELLRAGKAREEYGRYRVERERKRREYVDAWRRWRA